MTSPIESRHVRCPACGTEYETHFRASINTTLDPGLDDDSYIEEMTTGTCPECGHKVNLGGLVVRGDVWEVR